MRRSQRVSGRIRTIVLMLVLGVICSSDGFAAATAIAREEQRQWMRRLLPMPQEFKLEKYVEVPAGGARITVRGESSPAVDQARELLVEATRSKQAEDSADAGALTIELVVGAPDATIAGHERLTKLPNNEQAYLITAPAENRLVLAALKPEGLYYAARTMAQLLAANAPDSRTMRIPLPEITDWPDIQERGVWNYPDPKTWIPWAAAMKLNYGNMSDVKIQKIERDKPNKAAIDVENLKLARRHAFHYVPQIVHLNFLEDYGLFSAYPEMAGKGNEALAGRYHAHKWGPQHRVPFAGDPNLSRILAEWMRDIASQGGLDIACWLTERPAEDQRPETTAVGQFPLEAKAFLTAWGEARKDYPDLKIRMFLSTVSDERDYRVYDQMPADMKIMRACHTNAERVRHLPRDLFRNPLLDHYAAQGRWIGTYDVPLNVNGNVETPEFKTPHRSAHRVKDYVNQLAERKYQGAMGMMAFGKAKEICGYNIAALAEWGWNRDGRSEKEFAEAWATINGLDADQFTAWSELMGPVEWDVYDSSYPTNFAWGQLTELVRERRRPVLGDDLFRYYRSAGDFDAKLAACEQALAPAEKLGDADYANETRVVMSHVKLIRAIYQIAEIISTQEAPNEASQASLKKLLEELNAAGKENTEAIRAWRAHIGPEPWHERVHDAMLAVQDTVRDIDRIIKYQYIYY